MLLTTRGLFKPQSLGHFQSWDYMIQACSHSQRSRFSREEVKASIGRNFFLNILPLLSIIVYESWGWGAGKRLYSCSNRWPTSYTGASFYEQCRTSLRSGSVSGLEVSVVVEELSSSAKESFSSSSCCFPFPLLSFSSRFFCGLALRWNVFPFPREIRMLQILSSSTPRWAKLTSF